jgi:RNA polymerase sigma-70 factor, ECF subfamily
MSTWTDIATTTRAVGTYGIHSDGLDHLLIERIARRDRTAMQQLFERHYPRISGFFSGLALGEAVTDELTIDTFLTAWASAANYDRGLPAYIWLLALGYRCVLRSIVARRDQPDHGAGDVGDEGSEVRFDTLSRADWMRALSYLPIAQRVALELTYHLGHSCEEVAAIMGGSEPDVRRHIFVGRRKLNTLLIPARHRNAASATAAVCQHQSDALGDTGLAEMETVPLGQDEM